MHDGHRARLKKRFLKEGLDGFEHHNILELLLFFSVPRSDTNELAHDLIKKFGSFSGVFDAPYDELCKLNGVGEQSATLLKLIPSICRQYLSDKHSDHQIINSTTKAGAYLLSKYIGVNHEKILLVCLDNKCKVLSCNVISEGTVNSTAINIRKIIENIVVVNATSVILSHNHPGGVALPSKEDITSTKEIISALKLLDVSVIDHIIVADNDFVSLADSEKYAGLF